MESSQEMGVYSQRGQGKRTVDQINESLWPGSLREAPNQQLS